MSVNRRTGVAGKW